MPHVLRVSRPQNNPGAAEREQANCLPTAATTRNQILYSGKRLRRRRPARPCAKTPAAGCPGRLRSAGPPQPRP